VQKYWGGTRLDTRVDLSGFTPALAALALGTAINDRLLGGVDLPVSSYLPEAAPEQRARTLRELMSTQADDAAFEGNVALLARVLEKLTQQDYAALVAERLWQPLEAGTFSLTRSGPKAPVRADCCMTARLGDWLRVGALLANDGVFQGNQFTPPRYVTQMISPTRRESRGGWFTRVDGIFAAHDTVRLESPGMQRLWAVPSLQLVILRYGDDPGSKGWDEAMIPDTIVRGTSGWQSSAVTGGVDPKKFAPH
jgi:CubicO group peptidase (beta-lactamase class C family)